MTKPITPPVPDDDIGPLDEQGQQIWSPEEEEAIARVLSTPEHRQKIAHARAQIAAGDVLSHEEHLASMAQMKQRWYAERAR